MPPRAMHTCAQPGCPTLIRSGRFCAEHASQERQRVDAARPSAAQRGYDAAWQKIRAAYLRDHPFCADCGRKATDVDHIIPKREGGTNDDDNLRALCHSHHSRHTATHGGGFGNARK